MAASAALAGSQGCRRPEIEILPYARMPEMVTPGMPLFYATSLPGPGGARPVLVETHEGRPTKIEGHPDHPFSQGATDLLTQANILELYDPDRSRQVRRGGVASTWDEFDRFADIHFKQMLSNLGGGLCFLEEGESTPALRMLRQQLEKIAPKATWHRYSPYGDENVKQANELVLGRHRNTRYRLDAAEVIVALDCDFLGVAEASSLPYTREFIDGRQPTPTSPEMNRLYVVEPMLTVTGGMADHRLRLPRSKMIDFVMLLARELGIDPSLADSSADARGLNANSEGAVNSKGNVAAWIKEIAADLSNNRGQSVVMAGRAQPATVHAVVHLINDRLQNLNKTITFSPLEDDALPGLDALVNEIEAGEVDTLVILGGNPAYDAPADFEFAEKLTRVPNTIRCGLFEDETSQHCSWHVPAAHTFESWGDAETPDGDYSPVQPLIAPLFRGRSLVEFVARLIGHEPTEPYEIAKLSFAEQAKRRGQSSTFDRFLHDGLLADARSSAEEIQLDSEQAVAKVRQFLSGQQPARSKQDGLEVTFHLDSRVLDGRFANNGWLQEVPDPVTKLTWDNAALVSPSTAKRLGVSTGDIVRLVVDQRSLEIPVFVSPGQTDESLALALGYGRSHAGRVGNGVGCNVYPLRTRASQFVIEDVAVKKTGRAHEFACTQSHWAMEGRDLVQEYPLATYLELSGESNRDQGGVDTGERHEHLSPEKRASVSNPHHDNQHEAALIQSPPLTGSHQWGMTIDLNRCVGCSACMVACQSENNIPIVGKGEVANGRSMHWIRVDRYFEGDLHDPSVVQQPVACVHCENAPCETVCPVNAAVHSPEGLNLQVYNRCVGTRYCSNNCPYKVRRFNWFDYQQRPLDQLRLGPLAPKGSPETLKMQKNPDVSVRMRGVMEKCTYCVQRIERAKTGAKLKDPTATEFFVPDGTVTPACARRVRPRRSYSATCLMRTVRSAARSATRGISTCWENWEQSPARVTSRGLGT